MLAFRARCCAAVVFWLLSVAAVSATEPLPPPTGAEILTVTGAIAAPNRGAKDAFDDAYFRISDFSFERAAAFDRAMLEALGMQTLTAKHAHWPSEVTVEGPLLNAILDAAGATGSRLTVTALDGYQADFSMQEIRDQKILLALRRNGRDLGIGGRGPGWIIFPNGDAGTEGEDKESRWVWSVFWIEVHD